MTWWLWLIIGIIGAFNLFVTYAAWVAEAKWWQIVLCVPFGFFFWLYGVIGSLIRGEL